MQIQTREQEPNPFARVGRFAKASAMVRRLDYELRTRDVGAEAGAPPDPNHDPLGVIPRALEAWPEAWWAELARRAGAATKPSATTKALIIAEYRERSAAAAKLVETTGEELPVSEVA